MTAPASIQKNKLVSLCILLSITAILVAYRIHVLNTGKGEVPFAAATGLACVLLLALSLFFGRRFVPALPHGLPSVTFGASVSGFLLLTVVAVSVYFSYFAPEADRIEEFNPSVSMLVKLFALLSAAFFLLLAAYMPLPDKKALHLLLSLMPILFFALRILNDFIENSTMPLANSGGYHILGMIATMLFFLREAKFLTGNGKAPIYLAIGQIAVLLLAIYNIPLLLSFVGGDLAPMDAMYALLSVALIIYMLTRMLSLRMPELPEAPVEDTQAPIEE